MRPPEPTAAPGSGNPTTGAATGPAAGADGVPSTYRARVLAQIQASHPERIDDRAENGRIDNAMTRVAEALDRFCGTGPLAPSASIATSIMTHGVVQPGAVQLPTDYEIRLPATLTEPMQRKAVEMAAKWSLSVVVGPPGTGKTQVARAITQNFVRLAPKGRPVYFASDSKSAVDNFAMPLLDPKVNTTKIAFARSGHKDTISKELQQKRLSSLKQATRL